MYRPAQDETGQQSEKYQQRAGYRGSPEQKGDLNHGSILSDKYHRQAGKNNQQYQFQIHLSLHPKGQSKAAVVADRQDSDILLTTTIT